MRIMITLCVGSQEGMRGRCEMWVIAKALKDLGGRGKSPELKTENYQLDR